MTPRDLARQIPNAILIPIGIVIAMWPNSGPNSIGAISRETQPLFGAAGWAFSIWGAIFAGQLFYAIHQVRPSQRANPLLRRIGVHTALNAVGGAAWTIAFVMHQFALAWVIMLSLLVNLIVIELRMKNDGQRGSDFWLVRAPYSLNLGWISVATILNTAQFLYASVGWDGAQLGWRFWGGFVMIAALVLGVAMLVLRKNRIFPLVIAWSQLAIALDVHERSRPLMVLGVTAAIALVLMVAASYAMWRPLKHAHHL